MLAIGIGCKELENRKSGCIVGRPNVVIVPTGVLIHIFVLHFIVCLLVASATGIE